MASLAGPGEELRGDRVAAGAVVDNDPVRDSTDHAQPPAVLRLLVLVLDLRGQSRASVIRDRQGNYLRRDRERQMKAARLLAAGRVEDRVRAQLGVAVDAIDFESDTLHVVQQLKLSRSKAVFAPPKGGKLRNVPLPGLVADALRAPMKEFPPIQITLPWKVSDGPPVTKRLIFTGPRGGHVWRTSLNEEAWKRALDGAGVIPVPERGQSYAESRENGMHALRHFYASVLLDAGEHIKALAEYLGHSDPGLTLRVYAHLMPSSQERTRKANCIRLQRCESSIRESHDA